MLNYFEKSKHLIFASRNSQVLALRIVKVNQVLPANSLDVGSILIAIDVIADSVRHQPFFAGRGVSLISRANNDRFVAE